MLNKSDFQHRQEMILGMVVNEYIKTVSPVSSGQLANAYCLNLSPATIRNILAELETQGYLTHPHTSAGRVPTQEGYRYYVDKLMKEIQLLEEEKKRIRYQYEQECMDLDNLLEKTSQVISELTHYTSIISIDEHPHRLYYKGTRYIAEYQDMSRICDILTALEEKERLLAILNQGIEERIRIYIGHEMACSNMEECSLAVRPYQTQRGYSGRLAILGPTRMDYQRVVSALDYFSELMDDIL